MQEFLHKPIGLPNKAHEVSLKENVTTTMKHPNKCLKKKQWNFKKNRKQQKAEQLKKSRNQNTFVS